MNSRERERGMFRLKFIDFIEGEDTEPPKVQYLRPSVIGPLSEALATARRRNEELSELSLEECGMWVVVDHDGTIIEEEREEQEREENSNESACR